MLDTIETPKQGNRPVEGAAWCADNGCFTDNWDEGKWWAWLVANQHRADSCLFAVAPDVVGDAWRSHLRSYPWLEKIRKLGYPVAYVLQNRAECHPVPWHDLNVVFLGGSLECVPCGYIFKEDRKPQRDEPCPHCGRVLTEWKTGEAARALTAEAKRRGKWVHAGRVNSLKRLRYMQAIGCDSADGTYITFGPDVNLPKALGWLRNVNTQGAFELGAFA